MTNEANIDIQVDDNQIIDLVSTLNSLQSVLVDNAQAMARLENAAQKVPDDLKDIEQAADGARRSVDALGVAAAGLAAATAAIGAAVEGTKVAIEAFTSTNEEAAARMDILGQSAQTLLGSIGRVALGGDNFAQTLEVLTQMFERLNEFVVQNSDSLAEMATFVLRLLIQAFFGLIDAGLATIRFISRLDENMLLLEATFLDVKAGILEFADDALEGIGGFVAGAIEGFADLLTSLDEVQTAIIDNPVIRTLFGIDEDTVITGPVGAIANNLRDAAESVRDMTRSRFSDEIDQAAERAEALRDAVAETEDPIAGLREQMRVIRDDTLSMIDNLENISARPVEVNVNQVGGAGGGAGAGGAGGGAGAVSEEDASLQALIGSTIQGLNSAEKFFGDVLRRLYETAAAARDEFRLKGDIVPVNILSLSAQSPLVAEFENMLQQRRDAIERMAEIEEEAYRQNTETAQRISELSLIGQAYFGGGMPPEAEEQLMQDLIAQFGVAREAVYAAAEERERLVDELATSRGISRDAAVAELNNEIEETRNITAQANAERQEALRQQLLENEAITSASYDRERALLEKFYNQTTDLVISSTRFRAEAERKARLEANMAGEDQAAGMIALAQRTAGALVPPKPVTIDTSPLTTGFGMRADRDRRRGLQDVGNTVYESEKDAILAVTALLSDKQRAWADANGGVRAYIDSIAKLKEETREAFKADAIDAFEDTFVTLGSTIGTALGGGFDDSITGAERAKVVLFELLGSTLQALGSTAIAQGAIYAFGDPRIGGYANPVGAAGLIAAGTAAVAVGSAFSARAGAIQQGAGAGAGAGVTPATTPGAGGTAESTTNVFIQNRFGNRFDAREIDRAAAESFASAAAAGQA